MDKPMNEYAADAPRVLRDFFNLYFHNTRQIRKNRTQYYLDLRLFFAYSSTTKAQSIKIFRLMRSTSATLIWFIRDITLSDTYDYLEYMAQSRPAQQNSSHTITD